MDEHEGALGGAMASYWMASAPGPARPMLQKDAEADIAVVGGGIAGLCTARELALAGRSVVLVEADRVAAGVTGHTTAKLSAQHGLVYAQLSDAFGADAARDYAAAQTEAIEHVRLTAEDLGVDCDLETAASFVYDERDSETESLKREAEAARDAGLDAAFTTETGLPFPVAGAVRVEGQAQFHPRKFLLAVAEDLLARGGRVFEGSRVVDVATEDGGHRLTVGGGAAVRCREAVIATHYPVVNRARLLSRLKPRRELVLAAPVPADADPGGMYLTTADDTRSVRTAPLPDGRRLLIVTGEAFTPGEPGVGERYRALAAWTADRFGAKDIAYRWAAQDNGTPDRVPYIGRMPGGDGLYVACGFGGWGMSNGMAAARLITGLATGAPPAWAGLFDPSRLHIVKEAGPIAANQKTVMAHLVGDRLGHAPVASADELDPGQGAVIRVDGRLRAVYRDDAGDLHTRSAACTHMGCVVGFNDAERTWECPCHGSRFDTDGAVLQGPATAPLRDESV
ncbi:FAD-dependent oxidoreductase [Glycomyces artemisiae]|uniref:Glycine/D-amino acid oxidase-like deaminating enzyme n=1 Tax=Glycomyces artemisiae TaxID=1076443 RepID=A0A2T0UAG3_9ACTN|nr:FAD-dependent oxidoreductase [Glycomyces artemisiae]PRY54931.1 glycine/D-amino acid oxidase-like deaminating enzyme [Glycomyces artemisiae]